MAVLPLLPTTLVGSYPQPDWLIDRERLLSDLPPRVRARELWRIAGAVPRGGPGRRDARWRSATSSGPGIDILTDGEMRRESYSNRFATALEGMDVDNPGDGARPHGPPELLPRIVGPIRRARPVDVDDVRFLRAHTDRDDQDHRCPARSR